MYYYCEVPTGLCTHTCYCYSVHLLYIQDDTTYIMLDNFITLRTHKKVIMMYIQAVSIVHNMVSTTSRGIELTLGQLSEL